MIIKNVLEQKFNTVFFELTNFTDNLDVYLKLEHFNFGESIKFKAALAMIEDAENKGMSPMKHKIIESSSGNLGIALSLICKFKGYDFTCVIDSNTSLYCRNLIKIYGANVVQITKKDKNGGYLNSRIDYIKERLTKESNLIWLNQYNNSANPLAHYNTTAKEIYDELGNVDYIFVATSTGGTFLGCRKFFASISRKTKVVAVDAFGSLNFGNISARRLIPGVGASRKPENLVTAEKINNFVIVKEEDTIKNCLNILKKYKLLIGGSTGTVLSGIKQYHKKFKIPKKSKIVAISPDSGSKYITTIYNTNWLTQNYNLKNDAF